MGLGNSDNDAVVDEAEVGGVSGGGGEFGKSFGSVSCSICLEVVTDNGNRSWAKLQCGHQFHLDCIGSAFNVKGAMQCPNCRKVEKGEWMYANGCRPMPEISLDDWVHDEDLYDLREFSSNNYHDLLVHHTIFAEHTALSSTSHPCPYIAYFGPIHPSPSTSSGGVSDGSNFNSHWNCPSLHSEVPNSYAFPAVDVHYHSWEHSSPPFSTTGNQIGSTDQPSISPLPQRSTRTSSDLPRSRSFMHPLHVGRSSTARTRSSITSSMLPPYQGSNARTRERVQALQANYHQPGHSPPIHTPTVSGSRRSNSQRSLSQVGTVASSSDQTGFYFVPSATSGRNFQEAENLPSIRFRAWERDHLPSFSLNQTDRDSSWGTFHQAASGSDSNIRSSGFRQRHGSESMSSHNRS
ncbi:hypothetical protein K2173_027224 [Erythroxylum novogranatense]|uniref:RING-type domain-containing protein n=1 Tax=Erythroxylum novogranatense TaxID=1862640 RepID=A0AAV8TYG6_9ROSI|nr:hypothetical protein K2173_027224 [Erythroxylum novogranatense]